MRAYDYVSKCKSFPLIAKKPSVVGVPSGESNWGALSDFCNFCKFRTVRVGASSKSAIFAIFDISDLVLDLAVRKTHQAMPDRLWDRTP